MARSDHRHNFSVYFYPFYLLESADPFYNATFRIVAFLPQGILVALVIWRLHRRLVLGLLVETIIFVALNKVCTSQYFLWYLCLLSIHYPTLRGASDGDDGRGGSDSRGGGSGSGGGGGGGSGGSGAQRNVLRALGYWIGAQLVWLFLAYLLEFRGVANVFMPLWASTILLLASHVYFIVVLLTH